MVLRVKPRSAMCPTLCTINLWRADTFPFFTYSRYTAIQNAMYLLAYLLPSQVKATPIKRWTKLFLVCFVLFCFGEGSIPGCALGNHLAGLGMGSQGSSIAESLRSYSPKQHLFREGCAPVVTTSSALRNYSLWCSGPYEMARIEPELSKFKTSILPTLYFAPAPTLLLGFGGFFERC